MSVWAYRFEPSILGDFRVLDALQDAWIPLFAAFLAVFQTGSRLSVPKLYPNRAVPAVRASGATRKISKLRGLNTPAGFESHPLRHTFESPITKVPVAQYTLVLNQFLGLARGHGSLRGPGDRGRAEFLQTIFGSGGLSLHLAARQTAEATMESCRKYPARYSQLI